ncbi:unnamed protein product [Mytilus coruscus]|uniref:Ig-like domain-containing protein n=1 Tax=Mytilus coruscus TaxID=42192 RepID=A0A6J8BUL3_MYTCO|nr:unnamed protein product [Mytilus coruscus]
MSADIQKMELEMLHRSSLSAKVSISQNITGLIGNNDISLTCSFINEPLEQIVRVQFFTKNKTDEFDLRKPTAIFELDKPAKLLLSGNYLNGRVTMTNITSTSTNATLTFHVLKCEDEKDYICQCYHVKEGAYLLPERSPPTRISVQATSSKPDSISSIIVLSPKHQMQGYSSSIYNTSVSTNNYDILTFRTSSIDTVTNTHLQSTDKLPLVFREGDTVMFICTGDIGSPPGKLIWQKTFPQEKKPITYSNETTDKEEIPGECSFKGTSHLSVKIDAEDIKAKIRCFEESQVNVTGMYLETEPFDVNFKVNHLDINKQPNQNQYDQNTDNITLTCRGNGNPQPTYVWLKKGKHNTILSNKSVYVIENVIRNNSGVYICEVYNIIEGILYRKSHSVEIYIVVIYSTCLLIDTLMPLNVKSNHTFTMLTVHVDELPSSADSTLLTIFIGNYVDDNDKENEDNYYQTFSHDGITDNPEYASVIHTNNTTARETGDNLVCYNGIEGNKNKSRNNAFDRADIYDEVNQQATMKYELSKTDTPVRNDNVDHEVSTEISMNEGASDRTAVYDEINQQTTLKYGVSKAQTSLPTDNVDHNADTKKVQ